MKFHPLEKAGFYLMLIGFVAVFYPLLAIIWEKFSFAEYWPLAVVSVGGVLLLIGQNRRHAKWK